MTREQLIAEKAAAIREELADWAVQHAVLKLDEHLVFSLHIETLPVVTETVVYDNCKSPWEMSPEEFFSTNRLVAAGCKRPLATRIRWGVASNTISFSPEHEKYVTTVPTMRDFANKYRDISDLQKIPNLGRKSYAMLMKLLEMHGIPITDSNRIAVLK